MITLQKTIVTPTIAVLAGAGIYEARQASHLRDQVQTLEQQQAAAAERIQQLNQDYSDATSRLVALRADNERLNRNPAELLRLRGEIGVVRTQMAEGGNAEKQLIQPALATAHEYYNRSQTHHKNHEYAAELEDLNKAIELDPNLVDAYLKRGHLYAWDLPVAQGSYAKALPDFTRCLELKPDHAWALWERANAYTGLQRYDEAITDWTFYIESDVDFSVDSVHKTEFIADAYTARGSIYQSIKNDDVKALADYNAALQLKPNMEFTQRLREELYTNLESKKPNKTWWSSPHATNASRAPADSPST
jgi:tetratricopeptide (TPR) repeat protein